ncbi:Methyl-CpG DNA binding [Macleaya cordata]|uniref:Methyl-CpG DNA binding n=1 Tax=Macleaya cordata TaxID=56857 RepID=A0A200QLM1_MACCD|nr:Methyl-CpG DNA binding [Macleaya cordata]
MKVEGQGTPRNQERSRESSTSAYAVQCGKCFKWRLISTQEEYETIREKFIENPWFCDKKSNVSCEDPSDIEYDNTRTWVIDKPNLPKSPAGFKRGLTMRKDYSRMDSFYVVPTGKKVRSPAEVEKFIDANPKYEGVGKDLNFTTPKIMEDTIPRNVEATNSSKRMKTSKVDDD